MTGMTAMAKAVLWGALVTGVAMPTLASAEEPVTLRFWMLTAPNVKEFVASAEESFHKTHPDIQIILEEQQNEAYKTGLQVALVGSDAPDVFFNWSGEDAQRLIRDGLALDVTELANADGGFARTLSAGWLGAFSHDGRLYGAPTDAVTKYFYYNKGYFETNSLKPPKDFDELLGLCKQIRTIDPATVPLPLGNSERWKMNHIITVLNERVIGNAGLRADYALTADDDQLFKNPGYVAAWEKVLDMQKAGCFQDAPNATSPEVSRSMFSSQVSPMIFCGSWCAGIFDSEGFTDYAMFRFPVVKGGASDGNSNMVVPQGLQVWSKTKHPEAAVAWINHLVSPEVALKRAELLSQLPSNSEMLDKAKATEQFKWIAADTSSLAVQFNVIDVEVDSSVANAYLDAGVEILNGTMTPQGAMDSIRAAALTAKAARK